MMQRRQVAAGATLPAVTPFGGLAPRRVDQQQAPTVTPGATVLPPTSPSVFIGRRVIIFGSTPGSGLFIYSGTAAHGNPPVAYVVPSGVVLDPYTNTITNGGAGFYTVNNVSGVYCQMTAGTIVFGNQASVFISNGSITQSFANITFTSPVLTGGTTAAVLSIAAGSPPQFLFNGYLAVENATPTSAIGGAIAFAKTGHLAYLSSANNQLDTGRSTNFAAGQTINTTGFTAITGLSAPVESGIRYRFRLYIALFVNQAAGQFGIELLGPATSLLNYGFRFTSAAGTGGLNVNETAFSVSLQGPAASANSAYWIEVEGTLTPSAAGTLSVSGNTSAAVDTWTLYPASYLEVLPVV